MLVERGRIDYQNSSTAQRRQPSRADDQQGRMATTLQSQTMTKPKVVATVGLHGSASTWLFNVTRELVVAERGEADVSALYTDVIESIPAANERCLVIKSHHGSRKLDAWLKDVGALILLSVRDPRDAAISMARRFNAPLATAVGWLAADCARMRILVAAGHPIFRYEDRFFEDDMAVSHVAALLQVDQDPMVIAKITSDYNTGAVKRFTQVLHQLPPERISHLGMTVFDTTTQLHQAHIGDTMSGKWRALAPDVRVKLRQTFGSFLNEFHYQD
jgi:hypothetical protein